MMKMLSPSEVVGRVSEEDRKLIANYIALAEDSLRTRNSFQVFNKELPPTLRKEFGAIVFLAGWTVVSDCFCTTVERPDSLKVKFP